MAKTWEVYFGYTGDQHEGRVNELSPLGFRMTSLCAYGDSDEPAYAAVWVKKEGPEWVHCYGLKPADYQAFFDTWVSKGFRPKIVTSVTQPKRRLAAVLEKGSDGPIGAHNLSRDDFDAKDRSARASGHLLSWISTTANWDERTSAVWIMNTANVDYYHPGPQSAPAFQEMYESLTGKGDGLAFLTVTSEKWYDAIWHRASPDLNSTYITHHNMSGPGFQKKFDELKDKGWRPTVLQAGGDVDNARFAAMFGKIGH